MVYKLYILPIGSLYITYHLWRAPQISSQKKKTGRPIPPFHRLGPCRRGGPFRKAAGESQDIKRRSTNLVKIQGKEVSSRRPWLGLVLGIFFLLDPFEVGWYIEKCFIQSPCGRWIVPRYHRKTTWQIEDHGTMYFFQAWPNPAWWSMMLQKEFQERNLLEFDVFRCLVLFLRHEVDY